MGLGRICITKLGSPTKKQLYYPEYHLSRLYQWKECAYNSGNHCPDDGDNNPETKVTLAIHRENELEKKTKQQHKMNVGVLWITSQYILWSAENLEIVYPFNKL